MDITPTEIKTWLKSIKKDRAWLASQCLVSKKTVDNWLSPKANQPIKAATQELIRNLMTSKNIVAEDAINYEIPEELEEYIAQKSKELHKQVDDYLIDLLDNFVKDINSKLKK